MAGVFIVLLACVSGISAAGQAQVPLGSTVTLSGYSYSGTSVYLFLTGPNLPLGGVALDNVNRPADNGGATMVDVGPDGYWEYPWNTAAPGGGLDAGTYTVWIADGPADRSHLSAVDYTTRTVILTKPTLSAGIHNGHDTPSGTTGAINFTASPPGTSVIVNALYRGMAPLTIPLPPGTYNVTFSHPGYVNITTTVIVQEGSVSDVDAVLVCSTGSGAVKTTLCEVNLTPDGEPAGTLPAPDQVLLREDHTPGITDEESPVNTTPDIAVPAGNGRPAAPLQTSTIAAGVIIVLLVTARRK